MKGLVIFVHHGDWLLSLLRFSILKSTLFFSSKNLNNLKNIGSTKKLIAYLNSLDHFTSTTY